MSKIKIVHLDNDDIGLRVHLRNYVCYLRDQGYEVSFICNPGRILREDMVTDYGVFVKAVPFPPRITPLTDLKSLWTLWRYFRRERFDIVHTHTAKPGLLGRMAARLARVPIVVHTIHGLPFHEEMNPWLTQLLLNSERVGARLCDSMLSQNREDMETAVRLGICRRDKLRYLGNGIDVERFHPSLATPELTAAKRAELGLSPEDRVVGMIGRLVREKGFFEYVEAARILKARGEQLKFLAIGTVHRKLGVAIDDLGALIRQSGLEDTMLFLGQRDDVPELMAAMDLVVLASYAEGIPRVLMEAAAMGKPTIGTNVRGTRETISDSVTGRLVPVKDAQALADAIVDMLADPERAAEMGRAARRHAEVHFDERDFFRRTDKEYRRLIETKLRSSQALGLRPLPR
jgi:glycosyltransferase involved in cell wall biosynthesis